MNSLLGKTKWQAVLVVVALALLFVLSVHAQQEGFVEPFDDPALAGWEHSPGVEVFDGKLHAAPGNIVARPGDWQNFELISMMLIEGEGEVLFSYHLGEGVGYRLIIGSHYMLLEREDQGDLIKLGAAPSVPVVPGEWFHLELLSIDGRLAVLVNGELLIEAVDPNPLPPGGIIIETIGGVSLQIEEIAIVIAGDADEPAPEETAAVEPTQTEDSTPPDTPSTGGQLAWIRTGGPLGGIGYDIRYKFDQPTTWFVTDNFAGVHISTDDGLTWQPSNQGIPGQLGPTGDWKPIFSLTVDPNDPDIIWAGTDSTGHIYKSTDGGQTWTQKDNGVQQMTEVYNTLTFRGFTIFPDNSNIVFAMAEIKDVGEGRSVVWGDAIGGQVYKTVDGGENWSVLWDGGIPSSLARYLWINPEDTNIMYVSTGIFDRGAVNEGNETDPNPYGGLGILKTTDGGQTWRVLDKSNGLGFLYIGSLFMHPDDPDTLLAATGKVTTDEFLEYLKKNNLTNPMGVYRTTDGGETWTKVLGGGGFDVVEICTVDTDIVYAANAAEVYRSEDSGITWTKVSGVFGRGWGPPGVLAGTPIDFQCDPEDPNRLFSNNYVGGNFLSEDGGKTWKIASDGYTGAQTISIKVHPTNPAQIYSAGRNGIWGSHNGGSSWYGMRYPPEGAVVWAGEWSGIAIDPSDPQHLLATEETIWESFDGGTNWEVRQLPGPGLGAAIEFALSNPDTVYTGAADPLCILYSESDCKGGAGLYVSHDGGTTWEQATDENTEMLAVIDIAVDAQDANTVFIGTMDGLYKTTNGGDSWTLDLNLPEDARVSAITQHPADRNTLLAGVDFHGLFISSDGGASWTQAAAGLQPNAAIRDILFDPVNTQNIFLTDVSSGVYRSTDNGSTWTQLNKGLTNRAVTGLGISSDGQHLWVATNGEGVFRLDLNGQPPVSTAPEQAEPPASQVEEPPAQPEEEEPPMEETGFLQNSGLLIGIGVGLVVIIVAVAVLLSRRKGG